MGYSLSAIIPPEVMQLIATHLIRSRENVPVLFEVPPSLCLHTLVVQRSSFPNQLSSNPICAPAPTNLRPIAPTHPRTPFQLSKTPGFVNLLWSQSFWRKAIGSSHPEVPKSSWKSAPTSQFPSAIPGTALLPFFLMLCPQICFISRPADESLAKSQLHGLETSVKADCIRFPGSRAKGPTIRNSPIVQRHFSPVSCLQRRIICPRLSSTLSRVPESSFTADFPLPTPQVHTQPLEIAQDHPGAPLKPDVNVMLGNLLLSSCQGKKGAVDKLISFSSND